LEIFNLKEDLLNDLLFKEKLEDYFKLKVYINSLNEGLSLYKIGDLKGLEKIVFSNSVVFDCVTSGFTLIKGLFKHNDINKLKESLHSSNYFENQRKEDLYIAITKKVKSKSTEEEVDKLEKKFKKINKDRKSEKLYDKDWIFIKESYIKLVDDLVIRRVIKNPVMTVLYGSQFSN
jgi:hypothetical protein